MFKDNLNRILSGKKSFEKISQAQIAREIGVAPLAFTSLAAGNFSAGRRRLEIFAANHALFNVFDSSISRLHLSLQALLPAGSRTSDYFI